MGLYRYETRKSGTVSPPLSTGLEFKGMVFVYLNLNVDWDQPSLLLHLSVEWDYSSNCPEEWDLLSTSLCIY